jgi:3,4-dihydroxy 2-butanone 4-phosphate synthase/GTP cyclohydrolase II
MLDDLGVSRIRLLTNNPQKVAGLQSHKIEVVERVPLIASVGSENRKYLDAKRYKLGHFLEPQDTCADLVTS